MLNITDALISSVAGSALSLALAYIPGLNTQFGKLTSDGKRAVMGLLLLLTTAALLLYHCQGFDQACLLANWQAAALNLILALNTNQATFKLAVEGR